MKETNFEFLKGFQPNFNSAIYADYSRNIPTDKLTKLEDIVKEEKLNIQPISNKSCAHCILRFLKDLGKVYFKALEEQNKKEVEEESTEEKNVQQKAKETPKKAQQKTIKKNK